ncbi:NAD(P)/FAD-dependent oxidoreductase [Luteolibacter algae]|uniref:NAD(P)/FAD-dependent oxidoreductase n=1 Tax=Luteolibacter algae TaxID=454151 RepID=A0ABW5D854_9BACT
MANNALREWIMINGAEQKHIAIIGGGAAGFFAAITAAEADPSAQVTIYERTQRTLSKVKISGGGRCNVTHNCFEPAKLIANYPRGARELRGAFHRWQPQDTADWFSRRGVMLKSEPDGRMFPVTDSSQTIIDCFHTAARDAGVELRLGVGLESLDHDVSGRFLLSLSDGSCSNADSVCIATGSLKASSLTRAIEAIGHRIEPLAPSLFAFNVSDPRTEGLSGLSVQKARVHVLPKGQAQVGPVLITHRGFSGPGILRLSAWEARNLQESGYHFKISINWLNDASEGQLRETFGSLRKRSGKTAVKKSVFEGIPRRLWERLVAAAGIGEEMQWAQLAKEQETALIRECIDGCYDIKGKTSNKDEFVTCGGVNLKEINFKRMESKLVPNLHFAGECLDIDGITGGFNFQAAWTGGRLAGLAMAGIDS